VVIGNEALNPSGEGTDVLRSGHGDDMNAQFKERGYVELEVAMFTRPNRGGRTSCLSRDFADTSSPEAIRCRQRKGYQLRVFPIFFNYNIHTPFSLLFTIFSFRSSTPVAIRQCGDLFSIPLWLCRLLL